MTDLTKDDIDKQELLLEGHKAHLIITKESANKKKMLSLLNGKFKNFNFISNYQVLLNFLVC